MKFNPWKWELESVQCIFRKKRKSTRYGTGCSVALIYLTSLSARIILIWPWLQFDTARKSVSTYNLSANGNSFLFSVTSFSMSLYCLFNSFQSTSLPWWHMWALIWWTSGSFLKNVLHISESASTIAPSALTLYKHLIWR